MISSRPACWQLIGDLVISSWSIVCIINMQNDGMFIKVQNFNSTVRIGWIGSDISATVLTDYISNVLLSVSALQ